MKNLSGEPRESTGVIEIDYEEFGSELGNVAVSNEHIERDESDSGRWEKIRENFSDDKLASNVNFSDIEEMEFEPGSMFPNIRLRTGEGWKRMFFTDMETAEECFSCLEYRFNVFRENYR